MITDDNDGESLDGVLTLATAHHVGLELLHLQGHLVQVVLGPDLLRGLRQDSLGIEAVVND